MKSRLLQQLGSRLLLLVLLAVAGCTGSEFQDGDFVPAARRAQFHAVRPCRRWPPPWGCFAAPSWIQLWLLAFKHSLYSDVSPGMCSPCPCSCSPAQCPLPPPACLQQRTHWHDILGQHCPKFGVKRLVAVPLPQPTGFKVADDYKVRAGGCWHHARVVLPLLCARSRSRVH